MWDYLAPVTAIVLAAMGIIPALTFEGKKRWFWVLGIIAVVVVNVVASVFSVQSMHRAQEELLSGNREIAQSITGGDAYAVIRPAFKGDGKLTMRLSNAGKYPIYGVHVTIIDQDLFSRLVKDSKDITSEVPAIYERSKNDFAIGDLGQNQVGDVMTYELDTKIGQRNFLIYSIARNGQVNEELRLRWINDRWLAAFKVYNDKGTLDETVGNNFPRDQLWKN